MKFKVGDWAAHSDDHDEPFKVLKIINYYYEEEDEKTGIEYSDLYGETYGEEVCISDDEVALWQPQVGDYCWFYNDTIIEEKIGILRQFTKMEKDIDGNPVFGCLPTKRDREEHEEIINFYQYCEPFINEIPSYLQKGN